MPSLMMITRPQVASTSLRMWVERMTVRSLPRLRMRSRISTIWFGIEAGGRLVEDQDLRLVDQGLGEADALAEALRELRRCPCRRTLSRPQASTILRTWSLRARGGDAADPGDEQQVVVDHHVEVERRGLGQVAEVAAHLERVGVDVEAGDGGACRRRPA